jgi:hypothetical protein
MEQDKRDWTKLSLGQRFSEARPTKTAVFWSWVASLVVILILGFTWGGWVTGRTARNMAEAMADDAVVKRLAPMCVVQFKKDPGRNEKLNELKQASTYQGGEYVGKQGWATMPGEKESDSRVADECARLLILSSS